MNVNDAKPNDVANKNEPHKKYPNAQKTWKQKRKENLTTRNATKPTKRA